jgi:hypothetical protein
MQIDSAWHPLFNPQEFHQQNQPLTQAEYRLSDIALEARMVQVFDIRRRFLEAGVQHDKEAVAKDE